MRNIAIAFLSVMLMLSACEVSTDLAPPARSFQTTRQAVRAGCEPACAWAAACGDPIAANGERACLVECEARLCESPCTTKRCVSAGCDEVPSGTDAEIDTCIGLLWHSAEQCTEFGDPCSTVMLP